MKLIHISDIHINPEELHGVNPVRHFKDALAHIEKYHLDAGKIVITGDLTHYGQLESYQILRDMLDRSELKGRVKPKLMIGNHDLRENFAKVFPDEPIDENGFYQSFEETPAGLFVYLDTKKQDDHSGEYCAKRRKWLGSVLDKARAKKQAVWLFMHHNPVKVYVANADQINIVDESDFHEVLMEYRDCIRHIFFGHCHYTLSGSVCGIPFSAPRGTSHPCWPEFSGDPDRMGYGPLDKNYNVCFLTPEHTIVHSIDFEKEDHVKWWGQS